MYLAKLKINESEEVEKYFQTKSTTVAIIQFGSALRAADFHDEVDKEAILNSRLYNVVEQEGEVREVCTGHEVKDLIQDIRDRDESVRMRAEIVASKTKGKVYENGVRNEDETVKETEACNNDAVNDGTESAE